MENSLFTRKELEVLYKWFEVGSIGKKAVWVC